MPTPEQWERVFYHEAGHAVVALTQGESAPIVARCVVRDGNLEAQGTFQLNLQINFFAPGPSLLDLVMRAAGGRVAEEIKYGNASAGITRDMGQIARILQLPDPEGTATPERDQGYPLTRQLLESQWDSVVQIAEIGLRKFRRLGLPDTDFPNTQILSMAGVQSFYDASPLTQEEHQAATDGAYFYWLERSGTALGHSDDLANHDFIQAAGDVLGNTA
jgi:hypothetical protein